MGTCVLLKESKNYYLIYSITSKEFIVSSYLDKKTGSWLYGNYFDDSLNEALACFNELSGENTKENIER